MPGRWYLITDEYDSLENHRPECTTRVLLVATAEDAAIAEGWALYRDRTQYSGWGFVPGTTRYERMAYPRNPRVVYEIPLT